MPLYCPSGDVELQLRTLNGSVPSGTVIASTTIAGSSAALPNTNSGFALLEFSNGATVTSGSSYAIGVSSNGECNIFFADNPYTLGDGYIGTGTGFWPNVGDYRFRTTVDPSNGDNCPLDPNPDQTDTDGDGIGDVCDIADADGDSIEDSTDNCPNASNAGQEDFDGDGFGDVCDSDDDNDGLSDVDENTIGTDPFNADTDGDGVSDGDEVSQGTNPLIPNINIPAMNLVALCIFAGLVILIAMSRRRLRKDWIK